MNNRYTCVKRYVKEFINDRRNELTTKDAIANYNEYANKVLNYCNRGLITNVEAVKMISSVDTWELTHGEWKNRF